MHKKRLLFVLLIVVLVLPTLAIVPFAGAQEGPQPEAVGLRPDAPPFALHGPYWVGTMEFVIDPDGDRPSPVTIWYPAINPEGSDEAATYYVDYAPYLPGPFPLIGNALLDAAPDTENGPYPLVVYSHQHWDVRLDRLYYTEHLASHGFVVVVADHFGDTLANLLTGSFNVFVDRPKDITRVIDFAESLSAAGGALEGLIDVQRVAVTGFLFGGWTAVAASGAQWDFAAFNDFCTNHAPAWMQDEICAVLHFDALLVTLMGLEAVPEGLWPSQGDERVDAIVLLSPYGVVPMYGEAGLQVVDTPALLITGTEPALMPDWTWLDLQVPGYDTVEAYDCFGSQQKALVVFDGASPGIFQENWEKYDWASAPDQFVQKSDPVWDMDRAHDLINHFSTAFLLAEFYDDEDATAALSPDAVQFPGITYEAQGF